MRRFEGVQPEVKRYDDYWDYKPYVSKDGTVKYRMVLSEAAKKARRQEARFVKELNKQHGAWMTEATMKDIYASYKEALEEYCDDPLNR